MMRPWRFAAAVVLASGWGFIDGYFTTPWPAGFWVFLSAGLACIIRDESQESRSFRRAFAPACAAGLVVLGAQLCLQPVLPGLLARAHRIPMAASAVVPWLSAAGIPAGTDAAGNLLLAGSRGVSAVAVTWELAALPALARLGVALVCLGPGSSLARNLLLLLGAGAVRLAGIIVLVSSGARYSIAYEPAATMLMLLPLAFVLRAPGVGPGGGPGARAAITAIGARAGGYARKTCGALLLGAAGLTLGWVLAHRDADRPAGGRVLIDESRSDWEWTSQPFDHARYGQRSLYNYSLWRSWIELHHPTRVLNRPATPHDLAGADVLIIKTPTSPYERETIARIEAFVREGGGLYLIGDHTNLFGMSAVLNRIAAPYGISFRYDDTFPLDHEAADVHLPAPSLHHPVLRGIAAYPFETSCTLGIPLRGEPLIIGRRLGSETADYGQPNFFGNMRLDPSDTFGLFFQAAAVRHGRGRVVAFADSTNFSNFSMLWPGRRELTLNVLDWLNRPSPARRPVSAWLLPCAGCLLGLMGALALRTCGLMAAAMSIWLGIGAGWLGLRATNARTSDAFEATAPRVDPDRLTYDTSLSAFRLEESSPLFANGANGNGPSWGAFNAFFINSARSGVWPVVAGTLKETLSGRAAVLIWPRRVPSESAMKALAAYLRKGGRLLILDSVLNDESTGRVIAGAFGLAMEERLLPLEQPAGHPIHSMTPALTSARPEAATPGIRSRVTRGGATVLTARVGAGRLLVVFDAALFSDRSFGGVYTTPTKAQVEVYEAQREIMKMLLESEPGMAPPG